MKILIVDDHLAWRKTLCISFSTLPGIEVVGAVEDGRSALAACEQTHPDLVILDIHMPGLDGFETAQALLKSQPALRILGVTADIAPDYPLRAQQVGMRAIIPKDMILDYLLPQKAKLQII